MKMVLMQHNNYMPNNNDLYKNYMKFMIKEQTFILLMPICFMILLQNIYVITNPHHRFEHGLLWLKKQCRKAKSRSKLP